MNQAPAQSETAVEAIQIPAAVEQELEALGAVEGEVEEFEV